MPDIKEQTTEPPKPKIHRGVIPLTIMVVFLTLLTTWFLITRQSNQVVHKNYFPSPGPTSITRITELNFAFVKNGGIYLTNFNGQGITKIFDLDKVEPGQVEKLNMKFSPDKKYLAYMGISGGLDSAIKVIDIYQKKLVFQDVYGSATITDFSWSPDSQQIILVVNLKNHDRDYSSALYLVNPFGLPPESNPQFKPENIQITQVEWPDPQNIYYSRISYAPQQNTAIIRLNLQNKSRTPRTIGTNSSFIWINFVIDQTGKQLLVSSLDPGTGSQVHTFSLPLLGSLPKMVDSLPQRAQWFDKYIAGVSTAYGSPDSDAVVIDTETKKQTALLNMGPSGSFLSVHLIQENGRDIAVVWSVFDEMHSISTYDIESCLPLREKAYGCDPLWQLPGSSSPAF